MPSSIPRQSRSPSPENDIFAVPDFIVPPREIKTAGSTDLTFNGILPAPLKLHEDLAEGCGGQLWPAGMTLAQYMLAYHKNLRDKQIVEIGAGGGLVGLAVAIGCEVNTQLLMTDQLPMLGLMEKNVVINGLQEKVRPSVYDWGSIEVPTFSTATGKPDLILAADCVYFEPAFPLLLRTLTDLIGTNTICYFCFKKRRKADMRFIRDMRRTLEVKEVTYDWQIDDRRNMIFLYEVTSKIRS
ncbi:uncharacterized protein HMPREF1541_08729 [Cyphellophora europaea CBS 101466]|uniref:Protein-lysine N-methyltransferase EFM6 n=1 Tax=Cyphellophora europaea (strain CBS 101466) TaxID=1220924 RepID=W2RJ18_CYPE1|nr:uncharacterized protein HMPREF1541_08729 [Cyphellophora europaea CBS 101466]ETN36451.1 hypothetical protein HMPREF1541_08729 [Cyphellophora europaea CBS 101466]